MSSGKRNNKIPFNDTQIKNGRIVRLAVGAAVGAVFSIFKLPIPAPPVFAGLMGIVGLWIGYGLVQRFI